MAIDENGQQMNGVFSPTCEEKQPNAADVLISPIYTYEKCITCKDHGISCKGPKLAALRTIQNVREYHRRLRNNRKIQMKQIYALTEKEISNATVKDYFSNEEKDFRWTTVSLIDTALTSICAGFGVVSPEDIPPCPATSSEIKEELGKITEKLRKAEEECLLLQSKIAENKGKHIAQMEAYQADQQKRVDWLKNDVRLWRKIAFVLLGVLSVVSLLLLSYFIWDILNPGNGFIRY